MPNGIMARVPPMHTNTCKYLYVLGFFFLIRFTLVHMLQGRNFFFQFVLFIFIFVYFTGNVSNDEAQKKQLHPDNLWLQLLFAGNQLLLSL